MELTPQKDKHPQYPQQPHFPLLLHMTQAGSPLPGVFLSGTPPPLALSTHCQVALPGCSFATTVPAPPKAKQHPASAPGHPGFPFLCLFCQELLPIPGFRSALPGNPPRSLPLTSTWQRSTARMALTLGCAPKRTADGSAAAEREPLLVKIRVSRTYWQGAAGGSGLCLSPGELALACQSLVLSPDPVCLLLTVCLVRVSSVWVSLQHWCWPNLAQECEV